MQQLTDTSNRSIIVVWFEQQALGMDVGAG